MSLGEGPPSLGTPPVTALWVGWMLPAAWIPPAAPGKGHPSTVLSRILQKEGVNDPPTKLGQVQGRRQVMEPQEEQRHRASALFSSQVLLALGSFLPEAWPQPRGQSCPVFLKS